MKITKTTVSKAVAQERPYEIRGQHNMVLRVQPSSKKTFYVQIGRGRRTRLGDAEVLTLERAEYLARKVLNEAHEHGDALRPDAHTARLGQYIEQEHAKWLRANQRRAEKTLLDLKRCFGHLYNKRLIDISRGDFDRYVSERMEEGVDAATVVRDLNALRKVVRRAQEGRYIRMNPFTGWKAPKPEDNGVTRYLDADEENALRKALKERDDKMRRERESANQWRAERGYELLPAIPEDQYPDHLTPMVLVSLNTGLRYGELTALDWSAVNFRARVLTVTGRTAKGAKTRHIPLNDEARDVLARWKRQGDGRGLVFSNADGERIASVKTSWAYVLGAAGIEDFRWHDLRHTFASKLVQRGVALPVVRELLGHGDFNLTLRYAHLAAKQKAEAVAVLAEEEPA